MEFTETKIATYTGERTRIQLLKMTELFVGINDEVPDILEIKYQIRINRKRVYTTGFEYDARKYFATVVQNDILQLKIY